MLIGLRRARVARVAVVLVCALVCVCVLPSASAFLRLRSQQEIDDIRASTAASRAAARKSGVDPLAVHAHARYQSPKSGNSEFNNTAVATTIAEIDDNLADWINDRPHHELFFLPSQCDSSTRKCCMSYNDEVCGGSVRGSCVNVVEDNTVCKQTDGFYWFSDYFDYSCVCNGNFWGPACGECRTGWEGDDCNTRSPLLVRRDFASLSTVDKQYVIDAFRLAKLTPSPYQPNVSVFDFWAVIHHWSLPGGAFLNTTARPSLLDVSEGHVGSGAIPYHRALVAGIEHGLQYALGNYSFALPYWNWTFSQGNDNDETLLWFGGDGDTNDMGVGVETFCRQAPPNSAWMGECDCRMNRGPFALWPLIGDWGYPLNDTIERAFGCHSLWAPSLPFQPAVDCAITDSQFDMPTGDTVLVSARYNVSDEDLALWETGAVFHNLLGGGFLCGTYWTWPMAMKETDLHERTHRWLSGTLLGHHPASDPLFWMLHGYADTIYEQWLRNTNALRGLSTENSWSDWNGPLGHTRYECQGPLYPLQQQWHCFNDSRLLGFTYDIFNDDADTPTAMPAYHGTRWQHVYPTVNDPLSVFEVADVALVADASVEAPSSVLMFTPYECDADSRTCCPATDDGLTCGGSARGSCSDIFDSGECSSLQSDSLWWLTMNFDKVCVCEGNFAGIDCGSCAAGWTGENCTEAATVRVRRDFSTLSLSDRQYVVDAINLARVASSAYQPALSVLQYFAATVFWVQPGNSKPSATENAGFTHNMDGAVLWQRTLLQRFEAELARITMNDSFSLPYWNWAESMGNDNDPVLRYFGGDGATNSSALSSTNIYCRIADRSGYGGCNCSVSRVPFLNLRVIGDFGADLGVVQRAFACQGAIAASLPSKAAVEYTVTIPSFFNDTEENFAKTMTGTMYDGAVHTWPLGQEGDMLSRVQNWISGTMTTPGLATFRSLASSPGSDPMYWMALGYSDLMLERWMRTAEEEGWTMLESLPTEGAQTGMNRDECMVAMFPLTTNAAAFTSSLNVGYTYDFFDTL